MGRYRHPRTVGLPVEDWPELDQEAWREANRTGDLLTGSGRAARWKLKTRNTAQKAYGNWLRFLRDTGQLTQAKAVRERPNEKTLRSYIAALRARVSPQTVLTQIRYLGQAILAMDPGADRSLLNLAISRLSAVAVPTRNKTDQLVSPIVLLDLGKQLMAGWQEREAHDPRLNAMDFRDGFIIALLALCPIRLGNLAQLRIGEHLVWFGSAPRIQFKAHETKGGKAIDVAFPSELLGDLDFYLENVHPRLAKKPETRTALWPSLHNRALSEHGIYTMISNVSEAKLGRRITPHMFRDAAATFIAGMAPEQALMAASLLQHRSFDTTTKHYIHGQQHKASRQYQEAIDAMIERVDG